MINEIQIPSPLEEIVLNKSNRIYIKREDLIHPMVSGNKYRKLKYNLQEARNYDEIISFGGAFSNHIHALSFACHQHNIPLRLFVRGEEIENSTLHFVKSMNASVAFIDRSKYRKRNEIDFLHQLQSQYPKAYIIPEGGSNLLALQGIGEMVDEIKYSIGPARKHYCVSFGSGATSIGILKHINLNDKLHVFPALKIPNFEQEFIRTKGALNVQGNNFEIHDAFHFGGFAKYDARLISFINKFKVENKIALDPLYTGKMFYGVHQLLSEDYFPEGETIVLIHTGGLQGISGFNARYANILS